MCGIRFHDLPEELQDEIFCKLPFTSITVARRVCKQWLAKLQTQEFLVRYRDWERRPREQWIMAGNKAKGSFTMFSIQDKEWVDTSLALPASLQRHEDRQTALSLLGSCLGLWCIGVSLAELSKLVLCDPITRRIFMEIPLPWEGQWTFWGIAPLRGSNSWDRMVLAVACSRVDKLCTFHTGLSRWSVCDAPAVDDFGNPYDCSSPVTKLPFFAVRDEDGDVCVKSFDPEAIESPWMDMVEVRHGFRSEVGIFGCMGGVYAMVVGLYYMVVHRLMADFVVHRLNSEGQWDVYSSMKVMSCDDQVIEICSNEADKVWVFCCCGDDGDPADNIIEFDVRSKEWMLMTEIPSSVPLPDKLTFFEV